MWPNGQDIRLTITECRVWFPVSTQTISGETEPTHYFNDSLLEETRVIMELLYRDVLLKRLNIVKASHLPLKIGSKPESNSSKFQYLKKNEAFNYRFHIPAYGTDLILKHHIQLY